jgi:hypothetical protein
MKAVFELMLLMVTLSSIYMALAVLAIIIEG